VHGGAEEKMVSQDLSVLYWAPEFYRSSAANAELQEVTMDPDGFCERDFF